MIYLYNVFQRYLFILLFNIILILHTSLFNNYIIVIIIVLQDLRDYIIIMMNITFLLIHILFVLLNKSFSSIIHVIKMLK